MLRSLQLRVEGGLRAETRSCMRRNRIAAARALVARRKYGFLTQIQFDELGLAEPILLALKSEQYTHPTPIQAECIPHLLAGRDLLGMAQTGTGKTAAFTLPILQKLFETRPKPAPRSCSALILAPTRELVLQILESVKTYGHNLRIRQASIVGGVNQRGQVAAMARGVDILVATPGRLLDLMGQGHVKLDTVSVLVLDEADRMLDMGFVRDVRKIVAACPRQRQSLLFSATMPREVDHLAAEILKDPVRVAVAAKAMTADLVTQEVMHVSASDKMPLLIDILKDPAMSRVIVFTRTKHGANRVTEKLQKAGIPADALHSNKSQNARQRALAQFRSGAARVLVATDIAARGIDVDEVSHVVNFELPNLPESYVHRIGRTARAGMAGIAISFCDSSERAYLRDIEKLTRTRIPVVQTGSPVASAPVSAKDRPPVPAATEDTRRRQPAQAKRRPGPEGRPAAVAATGPARKGPADMPSGKVKWFNAQKGFGFIQPDDGGQDVFLHISAVERAGIDNPTEGLALSYELQRDPKKGKVAAANLKAI